MTIDHVLYLWDYTDPRGSFYQYDGLDQTIIHAALVRPRAGRLRGGRDAALASPSSRRRWRCAVLGLVHRRPQTTSTSSRQASRWRPTAPTCCRSSARRPAASSWPAPTASSTSSSWHDARGASHVPHLREAQSSSKREGRCSLSPPPSVSADPILDMSYDAERTARHRGVLAAHVPKRCENGDLLLSPRSTCAASLSRLADDSADPILDMSYDSERSILYTLALLDADDVRPGRGGGLPLRRDDGRPARSCTSATALSLSLSKALCVCVCVCVIVRRRRGLSLSRLQRVLPCRSLRPSLRGRRARVQSRPRYPMLSADLRIGRAHLFTDGPCRGNQPKGAAHINPPALCATSAASGRWQASTLCARLHALAGEVVPAGLWCGGRGSIRR